MSPKWLLFGVLVQFFAPSQQIIVSPCFVETIETHPHFGTSLEKKELVQIVQIPPVFTQTVIAGKCHNGSRDSSTSAMFGSYAVCSQRYSSVEVYVMKIAEVPILQQNHSLIGVTETFRAGQFAKDFILVESGCDFTFNFIPLIMQQHASNYNPTPTLSATTAHKGPSSLTTPHHYYFLSSPYHRLPSPQSHRFSPPPEPAASDTPYVPVPSPTKKEESIHYVEDPHSSAGPSPPNIVSHTQTSYPATHDNGNTFVAHAQTQTQGGNSGHSSSNYQPPNYYIPQAGDNTPSSVYVLRGEYPAKGESEQEQRRDATDSQIHGRGKGNDFEDVSGDEEGDDSEPLPPYSYHPTTSSTKKPDLDYYPSSELHGKPIKIGLPVYILSPEIDPLLKNLQSMQEREQS